ncbi:RDD family protein [Hymenobacter rubripertinctus]|uniref:RDD family protein n=1 Tax=Hymenobacter rubripertinctus TaxID=2029981 RepID=A0A418R421_9BACT|nr:RDD family protein [Hymenobacter rubripertinctus]RIY12172.1 RDD family protein [Hymenobacter rubripertinctus]
MSTIRIQTTQNVVLEYEAASVGDRVLAQLLDLVIMGLWAIGANFLINQVAGVLVGQRVLQYLLVAIPLLVYHPGCEIFFNGQSLGKQVRKIKVTRLDGTRPGPGDYLLRWLLGLLEIGMTLGSLALVAVLFNGRGQRLGDLAAGTTVVSLRPRSPDVQTLTANVQVPAGYQPVFPQARHLSDHDAALIRRLFQQAAKQDDYLLLNELAMKVKTVTTIRTELQDEPFIRTILRDHAYFAAQESAHG